MAEKPSSPASDLAELVTCSICLENFKDARALPCLHSYCKECLQGLVTPQQKLTCPHCRLEVNVPNGDVSNLSPNFFVNNVLEVLSSSNDSLGSLERSDVSATSCKSHPEKEGELFCQDCSSIICYKCVSSWGTCKQHMYEGIDTAVKMFRQNIEDSIRKREEVLPTVLKHAAVLADMKAQESDNVLHVSKEISDTFALHMASLSSRQDQLTKHAFDMQWEKDDGLSSEVDRVQLEQAKIENTIEFCRKILDITDPALFLQMYTQVKDKVVNMDVQELVSHVEVSTICFQATDSLLADVISNFGNVVRVVESRAAAEEEKPVQAERPPSTKKLPTAEKPPEVPPPRPPRPVVQHQSNVLRARRATMSPVTWRLYHKHLVDPDVTFEDQKLSVKTKSVKNVAIIGKPGFREGKHSWKVKVTGFPDGLSLGICVGSSGRGFVITYDSAVTFLVMATDIQVKLDCDARTLSVLPSGYQRADVLGYENPTNAEVHPYFYLPSQNNTMSMTNKISIISINGIELENNQSCCLL